MRIVLVLALAALTQTCYAGGKAQSPACATGSCLTAQQSAQQSAAVGVMAHRGGRYRYEGVGFSTSSAQDAIRNCCYYGQRPAVEIGVSRGRRGWYACIRYQ